MLVVMTTLPAAEAAEALAEQIVEANLAACVQILPPMTSVYLWEGAMQKETEVLLLIKTLPEKWEELQSFITANHSYEVPEIVALSSADISTPYAAWLQAVLGETNRD